MAADASVHLIQVLADNSADSWNDVGCVAAEKGSIELTRLYLTKCDSAVPNSQNGW